MRDTFACVKLVLRKTNVEKKVTRSWEFLLINIRFTFMLVFYLPQWIFYFDTSRDPLHFYHYYYNYYYFIFCFFPPPIFVVGFRCVVDWLICYLKAKGFTWRWGTPGRWGILPAVVENLTGVRFLAVVLAFAIREFQHGRPKLTSRESRKINFWTRMYLKI